MFPGRYFPSRYYAGRYWPKVGLDPNQLTGSGPDMLSYALAGERALNYAVSGERQLDSAMAGAVVLGVQK